MSAGTHQDILSVIAERRIVEARNQGLFLELQGRGSPLVFDDETWVPEDLRLAYRVPRNSGFTPPEFLERKEIISLRQLIDSLDDDKERLRRMRELNLNLKRKRPLSIGDFPAYGEKIASRLLESGK